MPTSAVLLAFVAASCLTPALAMPLGSDRGGSSQGVDAQVGPRRPGPVINPARVHGDAALGPHRPIVSSGSVDPAYLADR